MDIDSIQWKLQGFPCKVMKGVEGLKKEFQFSLAQLTVLKTSPAEISRMAAETGYDFVSMRQIYLGLPEEPELDAGSTVCPPLRRPLAGQFHGRR